MTYNDLQYQIELLNQEAWDIRVNDSVKALLLSEEAINKSRPINYEKGLAEGLRTYGFCLIRQSQHDKAINCLNEAHYLFEQAGDKKGQSHVYEYFGIIARSRGDYKSSLEQLYATYQLRQSIRDDEGEALALYHLGVTYRYMGNLEKALDFFLQCLDVAKRSNNWIPESYSINNIGTIYLELGNLSEALAFIQQSLAIRESQGDEWGTAGCLDNLGRIYFLMGDHHKAGDYFASASAISARVSDKKGEANALLHQADLELALGDIEQATVKANKCLGIRKCIGDLKGQGEALLLVIDLSDDNQKLPLLEQVMDLALATGSLDLQYKVHGRYYQYYKKQLQFEKALTHFEMFNEAEKEFHSHSLGQKILNLQISHQVEQSQKEAEIYRLKNIELANALDELKATQKQLIQSEKLASLGELTAGIAHEIQNPLNFVNNFAEVNRELTDELMQEVEQRNTAGVYQLATLIRENQAKILHHGQRADAIVKSMLQHSRFNTGTCEQVDINQLCDEYLRLAFHAIRSKYTSFHALQQADYDLNLGAIPLVRQEIGRVLVNLFNNAFYAMMEKASCANDSTVTYTPLLSVSTKRKDSSIEIRIKDNGIGIPEKFREKIFQPFFTTKPTGQGAGLGLSLSYDIVKAHGGELKVEGEETAGATFIIELPVP
ncbi:tetratricopeptide repeat protein [Flavihumibacter fluvii]|uniref:tetratricopeptide repeat protein n=1 Tax=Flavihumibacter fluvii TaxID=2838157 RepID=UPI001BDEF423|nr:tetratricopeptide repeat protein [Flavihumibacter fluvii]ULQ52931.1 tetratricopeptide repeat protein [Flavihumibacter fluvii]